MNYSLCNRMLLEWLTRHPEEFHQTYLRVRSQQKDRSTYDYRYAAAAQERHHVSSPGTMIVYGRTPPSSSSSYATQVDKSFLEFAVLLVATSLAECVRENRANAIEMEFMRITEMLNSSDGSSLGEDGEDGPTMLKSRNGRRPSDGFCRSSSHSALKPPVLDYSVALGGGDVGDVGGGGGRPNLRRAPSCRHLGRMASKRRLSSWSSDENASFGLAKPSIIGRRSSSTDQSKQNGLPKPAVIGRRGCSTDRNKRSTSVGLAKPSIIVRRSSSADRPPSIIGRRCSSLDEDDATWYEHFDEDIVYALEDKIDELEQDLMVVKIQYRKQKQANKELSEIYLLQNEELQILEQEHDGLKLDFADAASNLESQTRGFEAALAEKERQLRSLEEDNEDLQANLLRSIQEKNAATLEMAKLEEAIGRNAKRSRLMKKGVGTKENKATRKLELGEEQRQQQRRQQQEEDDDDDDEDEKWRNAYHRTASF